MNSSIHSFDPILVAFVDEFRAAARNLKSSTITEFPSGSCNWASEILGQFLHEKGFGTWHLVKGGGKLTRLKTDHEGDSIAEMFSEAMPTMDWITHDWLEKDGIHIDPTADQFKNREEFLGKDLPFVHRGNSPLSKFVKVNDEPNSRRNVLDERVHHTAETMHQEIRAMLGM